jgi:hypothetical protein
MFFYPRFAYLPLHISLCLRQHVITQVSLNGILLVEISGLRGNENEDDCCRGYLTMSHRRHDGVGTSETSVSFVPDYMVQHSTRQSASDFYKVCYF